jgi:hypothetical protein
MRQLPAALAAGLAAVALATGCGNSATASTHPSYASLLAGYGDVVGSKERATVAPTPAKLVGEMGQDWLGQICETQSEATIVGMKFPRLAGFFAKGYRETAPAGALSPNAVFRGILGACAAQGLP